MSGLKIKQNCFKVIQMTIYMALCFTTYRMQWIHLTFYWSYKTKFRLDKNVIVFICIKPLESLKAPIWLFMYRNKTTAFTRKWKAFEIAVSTIVENFSKSASQSRIWVKSTHCLKWLNGKILFEHPAYMANRRHVESVFIIYCFFIIFNIFFNIFFNIIFNIFFAQSALN